MIVKIKLLLFNSLHHTSNAKTVSKKAYNSLCVTFYAVVCHFFRKNGIGGYFPVISWIVILYNQHHANYRDLKPLLFKPEPRFFFIKVVYINFGRGQKTFLSCLYCSQNHKKPMSVGKISPIPARTELRPYSLHTVQ